MKSSTLRPSCPDTCTRTKPRRSGGYIFPLDHWGVPTRCPTFHRLPLPWDVRCKSRLVLCVLHLTVSCSRSTLQQCLNSREFSEPHWDHLGHSRAHLGTRSGVSVHRGVVGNGRGHVPVNPADVCSLQTQILPAL